MRRLLALLLLSAAAAAGAAVQPMPDFGEPQPEYVNKTMVVSDALKSGLLHTVPLRPQNASCPIYFSCKTMSNGLGDQLERYTYCLHVAKLLGLNGSDMLVHGFAHAPEKHTGANEMPEIAAFLGIETEATRGLSVAELRRGRKGPQGVRGLPVWQVSLYQVFQMHARLLAGDWELPCGAVYTSEINSCQGWCTRKLERYTALEDVQWTKRGHRVRQKCHAAGLGFPEQRSAVQVVWHVRNGDICLLCRADYYTELHAQLRTALGQRPMAITFESQRPIQFNTEPQLRNLPQFEGATYNSNATLLASICTFLTADVLITTGSSLPVHVASFGDPWQPVLFEERVKGGNNPYIPLHYHHPESAVLLKQGKIISLSLDELRHLFDVMLPPLSPLPALSPRGNGTS